MLLNWANQNHLIERHLFYFYPTYLCVKHKFWCCDNFNFDIIFDNNLLIVTYIIFCDKCIIWGVLCTFYIFIRLLIFCICKVSKCQFKICFFRDDVVNLFFVYRVQITQPTILNTKCFFIDSSNIIKTSAPNY